MLICTLWIICPAARPDNQLSEFRLGGGMSGNQPFDSVHCGAEADGDILLRRIDSL